MGDCRIMPPASYRLHRHKVLKSMRQLRLLFSVLTILLLLSACSLFPEKDDETEDWSAERLYNEGKAALDLGYFERSSEMYEKLQVRYPFGTYAQQAQLDLAYSYYKTGETASALAALERFIKLNPDHPHADYAYYLKGLTSYTAGKGLVEKYLPGDASQRDPGAALKSFQDFTQLVKRYPESKYVSDAQLRMTYLRNILAQHEVNVATYYMRRKAYVAAANRARHVIESYPRAPVTPEALVLLAKAYKVMEMDDLSSDALRVLELNYPNHPEIEVVKDIVVR